MTEQLVAVAITTLNGWTIAIGIAAIVVEGTAMSDITPDSLRNA